MQHNKPKRLFVKALWKNATRSLQAGHLQPALAVVESKVRPRCELRVKELKPLKDHFRAVEDFRTRFESYPIYALLAMVACAHFAGAPCGPCGLAAFAADLSQPQRQAVGIRRNRQRRYPAPSAATFCRLLQEGNAQKVEAAILAYQSQWRGPAPRRGVVALDGKEPKHSGGQHIVSAVNVPDLYYLGSQMGDSKTNEIPVARELMGHLDLEGRLVGLDALHTQQETSREIVQEAGGDYLLTVKKNQPGIRRRLAGALAAIPAVLSPRPPKATHAWTDKINRGRHEQRMLDSRPYSPEQACFPAVAQIGKVLRKTSGRKPETVYVATSRDTSAMNAEQWLLALRQYWGIENGVHQRVDASGNEDRSRVRSVNGVWVMGMFRRLAISIYAEWRSRAPHRHRASLHDFRHLMARHNKRHAYSLVSALAPSVNWRLMK